MALLEVGTLHISRGGAKLVDGVSFNLERGERLGIIGGVDAGKTLLALAIAGLPPADVTVTGSIRFDGGALPPREEDLAKLRGKRIGSIFGEARFALDPLSTVGAQLADAMARAGKTGELDKQVEALLTEIGLSAAHAPRYPDELEMGERRRVTVAMALAPEPDLLVADDPTAGLDLLAQRQIFNLIDRACGSRQMTLILVSHDLKAIAALSTRILVMEDGKAVESGEKLAVFGAPKRDYTKRLMGAGRHRARTLMRTPIGAPLLEVSHVTRRFRAAGSSLFRPRPQLVAVDDVSFDIRQGESLALVGPAGSGKSVLARIIAGLDRASGGELSFEHQTYHGTDLPLLLKNELGFVFGDPAKSFNPRLRIGVSVAEPLRLLSSQPIAELGGRLVDIVEAVGLDADMLDLYPPQLSAGERQRFAIARALITRPRLVILDEPVAALDVVERGELLVLLNRLRADFGLTFLVVGHDLEMILILADRVMVMDQGRIIETTTPAHLLELPQQPTTKEIVTARLPDVGIVPVM